MFMSMKYLSLVRLLLQDRLLPTWTNKPCPHCGKGTLTKLAFVPSRKMWAHRCRVKACQRFVQPPDFHPIFVSWSGSSKTSLQKQASVLLCAVASVPQHCVSKILDVDDKIVSRVYTNVDMARARFVTAHEKHIQYGGGPGWVDVEADGVDLGKAVVDNNKAKWEQWCGIVQRGSPKTLRLAALLSFSRLLRRSDLPARPNPKEGLETDRTKAFGRQTHRAPHRRCPSLQAQTRQGSPLLCRSQEKDSQVWEQGILKKCGSYYGHWFYVMKENKHKETDVANMHNVHDQC